MNNNSPPKSRTVPCWGSKWEITSTKKTHTATHNLVNEMRLLGETRCCHDSSRFSFERLKVEYLSLTARTDTHTKMASVQIYVVGSIRSAHPNGITEIFFHLVASVTSVPITAIDVSTTPTGR